ncbi:MAG: PepSY-like domain-containing protein [Flavisolibacter sp.]
MKLRILSLLFAVAIVTSCTTTRTSTSENAAYAGMPAMIRLDFERHYPDATNITWTNYDGSTLPIDWELTDWTALGSDDYVVRFDMGSDNYYAWYDADGTWIGSSNAISSSSILPSAVTTTLNSQYKDYTIESIQKETWKDKTAYELKLVSGDNRVKLLIDSNGTIIKQKDK